MSSGLLIRLRTEDGRRHRNGSQAVPFVMWAHRWRFSTFGARARRRSSRSETDGTVHPPLAPSTLHFNDGAIMPLDVVISVDDHTVEFRTNATAPVAVTGRVAELQQWWIPDAYDAVVDVGRTWVRERPTDDHEHCLLDWAKIGHGGAEFGWRCNREWVCEPCYDEYFCA